VELTSLYKRLNHDILSKVKVCLAVLFAVLVQQSCSQYQAPKFVFYFHGGVVTELGDNAINQSMPEWGPYEYSNILDSLRKRGFRVFSEIRKKNVDDSIYVNKLKTQVDSLLANGVEPSSILLLGASAGSYHVLMASSKIKNDQLKVVIMGGCWPDTYKEYSSIKLYGNFLSVLEKSDPHKTCEAIFNRRNEISGFKEIELDTGLSHGFIYKGYADWLDPVENWFLRAAGAGK
jgi:hypothetical protein